jgi:hypothetical protein
MLQTLPPTAQRYGRTQRREIAAATSAALRLWGRMGPEFDGSYALIERQLWAVMDTAQERVTAGALEYIPAVLDETGQRNPDPDYEVPVRTLVGTAGDGLGTDTLAYGAVIHAKSAMLDGATAPQALANGGRFLSTAVGTLLSDTGRTAEKMASQARRVTGYVRMLEPPSCSRCVILAGKWSRRQEAFDRHPKCDCRNIPASESVASDLAVDPRAYFDSLDDDGLTKAFGSKVNAQAYKDGADFNQLVNAYRRSGSVAKAQEYGRSVKYSYEGITRRGQAYFRMSSMAANQRRDARGRNIVVTRRLMPESIYSIAKDRADAQRLLRLYGWI